MGHGEPVIWFGLRQCVRQFTHPVDMATYGAIRMMFIDQMHVRSAALHPPATHAHACRLWCSALRALRSCPDQRACGRCPGQSACGRLGTLAPAAPKAVPLLPAGVARCIGSAWHACSAHQHMHARRASSARGRRTHIPSSDNLCRSHQATTLRASSTTS
jgi:hypothetical protein